MPNGQSPKIKGSVCNVPVEIMNVSTLLPRQTSSNGLVLIKFKKEIRIWSSCLLCTSASRHCFKTAAVS